MCNKHLPVLQWPRKMVISPQFIDEKTEAQIKSLAQQFQPVSGGAVWLMPMFMSICMGFKCLTCRFPRPETAPQSIVFKVPSHSLYPLVYLSLLEQGIESYIVSKTEHIGQRKHMVRDYQEHCWMAWCFTAFWFLSQSVRYFLEKYEQWIFETKSHNFSLWRY